MITILFIFLLSKKHSHLFFCFLLEVIQSLWTGIEPSALFSLFNYFMSDLTRCYWRFIIEIFTLWEFRPEYLNTAEACVHSFESNEMSQAKLNICKREKPWQCWPLCGRQDLGSRIPLWLFCLNNHYATLNFLSPDIQNLSFTLPHEFYSGDRLGSRYFLLSPFVVSLKWY